MVGVLWDSLVSYFISPLYLSLVAKFEGNSCFIPLWLQFCDTKPLGFLFLMNLIVIVLIQIHRARHFYENLVPSYTLYDVDCPDHSFRKFTEDGQYLISFSRNYQELIVYRPAWLSFSCCGEECDSHDLPSRANKFDSFFTQLYCVSLASSNELICKDFFVYMENNRFGLFATSTAQVHDAPATGGAVHGVPSIEKITFHLLRCAV